LREISRRLFELSLPDPNLLPYDQIRQLLPDHFQLMADNETLLLGYMRGSNAKAADPEAWAVLDRHRVEMERWALKLVGFSSESQPLRRDPCGGIGNGSTQRPLSPGGPDPKDRGTDRGHDRADHR
jgi:hypothetical protein